MLLLYGRRVCVCVCVIAINGSLSKMIHARRACVISVIIVNVIYIFFSFILLAARVILILKFYMRFRRLPSSSGKSAANFSPPPTPTMLRDGRHDNNFITIVGTYLFHYSCRTAVELRVRFPINRVIRPINSVI